MTTQTSALVSESRGLRGILAMTVATIALVGAVAVWQPWSDTETGSTAPAATVQPPAPLPRARSATESSAQVVAIVASDEAAERLRAGLRGDTEVREWTGGVSLDVQVVVAATELEAGRIVAATDEANRLRAGLGLPGITVTDLRHSPLDGSTPLAVTVMVGGVT